MDKADFERVLPRFNEILISLLSCRILHNYIKNSTVSSYVYTKIEPFQTEQDVPKTAEFTIHYDSFYRVPVFSFRPDSLEHYNPYCALDIHPILATPYLYMHPCETETTMEDFGATSALDYLVKWLGMVLSLVIPEIYLRYRVEDQRV